MTKEKAILKLARMDNLSNDPEQERLNLVEYFSRRPNANGDVLDQLAFEARAELLAAISRNDAEVS